MRLDASNTIEKATKTFSVARRNISSILVNVLELKAKSSLRRLKGKKVLGWSARIL